MREATYYDVFASPIGTLKIIANDNALVCLKSYALDNQVNLDSSIYNPMHSLLCEAKNQIQAYFQKRLQTFDIPLHTKARAFEQKVWEALQEIRYGTTASYKEIAIRVGKPNAYRAVGNANHHNPILLIIPCHRITQSGFDCLCSNSKLGGYALGIHSKLKLLALEGIISQ